MTFKPKFKPKDLQEWLEVATGKLSEPAKQRIQSEIECHHAESVSAHIAGGASEEEARTMALADLGDARKSNREFRRRYLMALEAQHLDFLLDPKRKKMFLFINYFMFAISAANGIGQTLIWKGTPSFKSTCAKQTDYLTLQFIFLVVLPTISFLLSRASYSHQKVRLIVLLESVGGYCVGIVLSIVFNLDPSNHLYWIALVLGVLGCFLNFWPGLQILKKLRVT